MNSYGPVSLAYEAIYKLLHYMNWFSNDVRVHVLDTESMTTPNDNPQSQSQSQ